jgi:hypothetical protein
LSRSFISRSALRTLAGPANARAWNSGTAPTGWAGAGGPAVAAISCREPLRIPSGIVETARTDCPLVNPVFDESLHDSIKNQEPPYECTVIYQCER